MEDPKTNHSNKATSREEMAAVAENRSPEFPLAAKEQEILELKKQIEDNRQAIEKLSSLLVNERNKFAEISKKLYEREQILQDLNAKLWEIYGSRAWRIVQIFWKLWLSLIPPTSGRAAVVRKLYNLISLPKKRAEENRRLQGEIDLVKASNFFDVEWYKSKYPDVAVLKIDPAKHYLVHGAFEGKDPGPNFSSNWYFNMYPDVRTAKINPLIHYIKYGNQEGRSTTSDSSVENEIDFRRTQAFRIVPYYLDSNMPVSLDTIQTPPAIAVHLHIHYRDMLDKCAKYLNNVPFAFDLYISVTEKNDPDEVAKFLQENIPHINKIVVKRVPNRGRDLAPLIVDFGRDLLNYDFVAHIHTKRSPHNPHLDGWFNDIMDSLFGSRSSVSQILNLLSNDARFVYPAPNAKILIDGSGWGDNAELAKSLLPQLLGMKIDTYPLIEFPQGSMFWAKSEALRKFLEIPLAYNDFPVEPIPADGTIMHVLERLLFIAANHLPGRNYRVYLPKDVVKEAFYESQRNYTQSRIYDSVKVLSYYLPQFYPTPENDEWHGKGFTEWTKVRSTNPLFFGHYQQRVPHEDIGYYSLTTPEMLRKQVELMKCSGVYGQIFYHYWFTGKLILEKPAQMLLSDKSIEMPFCFCWANENWTKKWDGNENEILLGQQYSEQDAIGFISYLIPFFKDERYIKIGGRPVLFVYRPSSIPDFTLYKNAWAKVCAENGLETPYIVAVLTRGAKSPVDFDMDAGCERVLHDWTAGNVKEIKSQLYPYWPVNGSILNYSKVADYYMSQKPDQDFTYFRSIIPSWDNSPRYGSEAFVIHKSTPEKFQEWLEALVVDAQERLPDDRRFVVINAWNEWAESAALEPDKRFGYAYLNSIGRALSGIDFTEREYLRQEIPETLHVSISLDDRLIGELQKDDITRRKLMVCISNSSLLSLCNISFEQEQVSQWMFNSPMKTRRTSGSSNIADYNIHIKNVCYFAPDTFENMLKMALWYDAGLINPTHLNDQNFTHSHMISRWETRQISKYLILVKMGDKRSIKCCVDAEIFISQPQSLLNTSFPKVSTIIRFSKSGNIKLLRNALYSLLAQTGCSVQPILALQDVSGELLESLEAMLKKIPWEENCYPVIQHYSSTLGRQDLRSLMLNESFKSVETKYAAFLDYDDTVFHDAYAWLITRLEGTDKNASFGLIYNVAFNMTQGKIKTRTVVYDYGKDYRYFVHLNHSPIHGMMFNLDKIDRSQIKYHEDMKFMEDYYLTLQIFNETDTDWGSLKERKFVGDYYHYEDKPQTLAILDTDERSKLMASLDYKKCEAYIAELKIYLRKKYNL